MKNTRQELIKAIKFKIEEIKNKTAEIRKENEMIVRVIEVSEISLN